MKIGLVGGAFDPLHVGHLLLASMLRFRCEPDEVWLLPVARHVFQKKMSPFEDRLEMARIGAKLLGTAEARDTEQSLVSAGGDGSTLELLRRLRTDNPEASFVLALGADAWAQRDAWREFDALRKLTEIAVFNRAGAPEVAGAGPTLPALSSSAIREAVHRGEPIAGLVPAEVERYIRARGLYR